MLIRISSVFTYNCSMPYFLWAVHLEACVNASCRRVVQYASHEIDEHRSRAVPSDKPSSSTLDPITPVKLFRVSPASYPRVALFLADFSVVIRRDRCHARLSTTSATLRQRPLLRSVLPLIARGRSRRTELAALIRRGPYRWSENPPGRRRRLSAEQSRHPRVIQRSPPMSMIPRTRARTHTRTRMQAPSPSPANDHGPRCRAIQPLGEFAGCAETKVPAHRRRVSVD